MNVKSYAEYYRGGNVAPAGSAVDWIFRIRMRDGSERSVQAANGGEAEIQRVRHGRYCDVIPSRYISNGNYNTFYCDSGTTNNSRTGRVVARSGNTANANNGLVNVNANNDAATSNSNYGARLTNKIQGCNSNN